MFSTVVAFKKFLLFLGTSVSVLIIGTLYNSDFKSKYNYFLIKAINKTSDESYFSSIFEPDKFLCKFNNDSANAKNQQKTDKCEIFNLNKDDKNNQLFDVTNFSENDLRIKNYSKIKTNDFYLLKILGKDLEKITPNENKVSLISISKASQISYYDFSIVANFERDYRGISGNYLFGKITDLEGRNPTITLAESTKYLCRNEDCDIHSIETDSEKSDVKKIKWESKMTKISSYGDLVPWQNADGKRKFYILDMKGKTFTNNTKPDEINVSYVVDDQTADKNLLRFQVLGVAVVNFSNVPVRGFLMS